MAGHFMVAGDYAKRLVVRSLATGDVVHSFRHGGEVFCCAVSGGFVVAGDAANKLVVRSLSTGDVEHMLVDKRERVNENRNGYD